jgi:hypothetical protein
MASPRVVDALPGLAEQASRRNFYFTAIESQRRYLAGLVDTVPAGVPAEAGPDRDLQNELETQAALISEVTALAAELEKHTGSVQDVGGALEAGELSDASALEADALRADLEQLRDYADGELAECTSLAVHAQELQAVSGLELISVAGGRAELAFCSGESQYRVIVLTDGNVADAAICLSCTVEPSDAAVTADLAGRPPFVAVSVLCERLRGATRVADHRVGDAPLFRKDSSISES